MSHTVAMARRVLQATAAAGAVILVGLMAAVLLGSPAARAGSVPAQILGSTTAPHQVSTSVAATTSVAPSTTAPVASTTASTVARTTVAPPVTASRATAPPVAGHTPTTYQSSVTAAATTSPPTVTTTTIAPLGNSLPVSPVTLPLVTRGSNAHVNPVFAMLSGIGFFIAVVIVGARLFSTRAGGPDRRPLPPDELDLGPPGRERARR